ncbi:MAG: branched-chain amino acid ABC transporter permease [Burkholderiales bacterium]|nr:branched-chain amino acid ABC transporter permease [Burkholderiales bacterium]
MTPLLLAQGLAIGLVNGALYILTALGLTLIYGILHIVNFAHGEIYMLGAMAVYVFFVVLQWPLGAALAAIVLLAALLGLAIERGVFRNLRGQWMQLLVASVGISLIIQSLSWIAFGAQEKNVPSVLPGVVALAGVRVPIERLAAAGVALVLVAALYWVVYRTRTGLAMRAIEEDEETARMLGVNADRVAAVAVALGFILAGLGGAFVAPIYSLNPGMGLEAILMSFIIIIIGGLGSITGTVLAGLAIGVLQSIGALALGAEAAHVLVFAAMIAVLILRPQGLLGRG